MTKATMTADWVNRAATSPLAIASISILASAPFTTTGMHLYMPSWFDISVRIMTLMPASQCHPRRETHLRNTTRGVPSVAL